MAEALGSDLAASEAVASADLLLPLAPDLTQVRIDAELPAPLDQLVNLGLGEESCDADILGVVLVGVVVVFWMLVIDVEPEIMDRLGQSRAIRRLN